MDVIHPEPEALEPAYLTRQQAAVLLAVGEDAVSRLLRDGRLRGVRIGRRWRIPREALGELAWSSPTPTPV